MIIFLNGASSAGKSTVAREIMHQSPRPYLYYSINHLVEFWLDEKFVLTSDEPQAWIYQQFNLIETEAPGHIDGPDINQLRWDMIAALTVLIKKGYDLIIDELLWDPNIFRHYINALSFAKQVYLIRIDCDLIECEARERKRLDRFVGLTRASYAQVYGAHPFYDLTIDTATNSAKRVAQQILAYVNEQPSPSQFNNSLHAMITFAPLQKKDFSWLKKWLNTKHVKSWWGQHKRWTSAMIAHKYAAYLPEEQAQHPHHPEVKGFIIQCGLQSIGFIELATDTDILLAAGLQQLPKNIAVINFCLGEPSYLRKGLAVAALTHFLKKQIWPHYSACFATVDKRNTRAIQTYRRAGFDIISQPKIPAMVWMIKHAK